VAGFAGDGLGSDGGHATSLHRPQSSPKSPPKSFAAAPPDHARPAPPKNLGSDIWFLRRSVLKWAVG
jgi:hypothetical protein